MSGEAEDWRKVPGWRLEVSDRGRVRNLAGRVLELAIEKGAYRVRYTGADEDRTAKRMFSIAPLVLHVFAGSPLTGGVEFLDGDTLNCSLINLRARTTRARPWQSGPKPCLPPDLAVVGKRDGEIWRRVPGYRAHVSNLGRVVGASGRLLEGSLVKGRPRVRVELEGRVDGSRTVLLASLVQSAFRDLPIDAPARHINGDTLDCRLANIELGQQPYHPSAKRADRPWLKREDNALHRATSFAEAARLTGHSEAYCRKRMRLLGIELAIKSEPRSGISRQLVHRDLSNLDRYVALLQNQGIDERAINLGLRILRHKQGGYQGALAARRVCIQTLLDLGLSRQEVGDAVGMAASTIGAWEAELGRRQRRPEGWKTSLGPIDYREDEEWRDIPGYRAMVSSEGRVATSEGYLMAPATNNQGRHHVGLASDDGKRETRAVARLVLEAFKPELKSRKARYLNGDQTDNRVANLVPKTAVETQAEVVSVRRRGNLADAQATGSRPDNVPLWVQADAIVSRAYEPHVRADLISDMVVIMMEGRAQTMADAFKLARKEHNVLTGAFREKSLDAPLAGTEDLSLLDMITSDGEFYQR